MSLRRALDYPYDIPSISYVLVDGKVQDWPGDIDLSSRTPVLACGSNQSPTQLKRKFPKGIIPVMAGWLSGYDSVYSAHFTTYGSVAATYMADEKVTSRQMITWLSKDQLEIMHATEALGVNYDFVVYDNIDFRSDCHQVIKQAFTYESLRGPLCFDGKPVGLEMIAAKGRSYQALNEEELQKKLLSILSDHTDLAIFVQETIEQDELRTRRTKSLVEISK